MGPLDETVMFRVVLAGRNWQQPVTKRSSSDAELGAVNWLMGRGMGVADAMDGGVWASALSWLGAGANEWPAKDIVIGPVGALLGPGARELVTQMLRVLYRDVTAKEVNAVLEGELRATNVLFSKVPSWYLSMNYVLTGEGVRRANPSLVAQLRGIHPSGMPRAPASEFHEIAPEKPVSTDTKMFRWLEQVAGMGLTYGLHATLVREQSKRIWVYAPMFIVAGTAAVSVGRNCYAAVPSAGNAHEWVILPCFRDGGLVRVRDDTLRDFETPRFLATIRPSSSSDGRLVLSTSSLLSSPNTVLEQSKGVSVGAISDGPYKWDCTVYSADMVRIQRLTRVDKAGGGWEDSVSLTKVLNTHAPGMVEIKRRSGLVYTPPRAAWMSLVLDGASTVYVAVLAVLTVRDDVSEWGRVTFVLEILAEVGSRVSAVVAWSRSPGNDGSNLGSVATAIFAPVHWVLRNPGRDAKSDGWLWRTPLRIEAWGGLLSLGPLAAAASLDEVTSYQVALLAVVSTIVVGSLRFNELWEELVGLPRGQSAGVCASYALMYVCGLLVQSSFLVVGNIPWWALLGVVFGVGEAVTAVRSAVGLMRALEAVGTGRGEVLRVALASDGGLLGALTMSGDSQYGDMWAWQILAVEEVNGALSWSPASVQSVAGADFRGLSFVEIGIPDENIQLLCAHSDGDHTPAATHVMALAYRRPGEVAVVEVMPGACSATEAIRRSGVSADYSPILAVKVGAFYLPVAMDNGTNALVRSQHTGF